MAENQLQLLAYVALAIPVLYLAFSPQRVLGYIQRKRYQYEVTFSLYMLTPTEKFVFNSVLFLFVSMVFIGAALYLPGYTLNIVRRAGYYLGWDDAAGHSAVVAAASSSSLAADTLGATVRKEGIVA